EAIHVDVSQHRTDNTTLRSAAAAASSAAHASLAIIIPLLDRRLEPHLNEVQDIPIDDAPSNRLHQFSVRDRVEVSGQIRVYHISVAAADQRMDFLDRVDSAPFRTVAIGARVEVRFEDRLEYKLGSGLHRPVPYRRDAERSFAGASRLREHHPPHWCRPARLLSQALPDAG